MSLWKYSAINPAHFEGVCSSEGGKRNIKGIRWDTNWVWVEERQRQGNKFGFSGIAKSLLEFDGVRGRKQCSRPCEISQHEINITNIGFVLLILIILKIILMGKLIWRGVLEDRWGKPLKCFFIFNFFNFFIPHQYLNFTEIWVIANDSPFNRKSNQKLNNKKLFYCSHIP